MEARAGEVSELRKAEQDTRMQGVHNAAVAKRQESQLQVRCGVVRCGAVRYGVVRCDVVWYGVVRYGVVWCVVGRCGSVGYGTVRCGMVWCGPVRCGVREPLEVSSVIHVGFGRSCLN